MRRKKNIVFICFVLLTGIAFLFSGCSGGNSHSEANLVFTDPQWHGNQKQIYDLIIGGQVIGTSTYEIKPGESNGKKIYTISANTIMPGVIDVSSTSIWADTLKPILTEKTISVQQQKSEVKAQYNNNRVNLTINIPPDTQNMELSLPQNTYDNDEILMILQAIPFKEENSIMFNNFSSAVGRTFFSELHVVGKEKIIVDAGTFECFKIEMKAAGETHYSWYSTSEPRRLIMYDNGRLIFKLKETL